MRGHPRLDAVTSRYSRSSTQDKPTSRQKSRNPASYEHSVGYRLATEGGAYGAHGASYGAYGAYGAYSAYGEMGASGTLQIWPKVANQDYHQLRENEQPSPYSRSVGEAATHQKSVDDVSTLHSYRNAPKPPLSLAQKPSMSSVRDVPSRKAYHTLHPAASNPNFHFAKPDGKRGDDSTTPPKSPRSTRSQRLGLSKLFHHSKDKEARQAEKKRYGPRIDEHEERDGDLHHMRGIMPPPPPPPDMQKPAIIQRSHQTAFERNATENAKVNVRRPPKGIKHWFEGLDGDSDNDYPEVVQASPEPVTPATFRPSLGPGRLRAAPTSRVSPAAEPVQEYFHFQDTANQSATTHHHPTSAAQPTANLQEHSMLNLSSSDEEDMSEPPSPDRWPEKPLANMEQAVRPTASFLRTKSRDAGDSVLSMQTTMTSGSIPIINADTFYRTPLPPLPTTYRPMTQESSAMPLPLRTRSSEMTATRGRAPTTQSIPSSVASENSGNTASTTHVMTVTQEEMALLEMMRRKRAEMHNGGDVSPMSAASRQELHPSSLSRPKGFERQNSTSKSIASSTISRDSDRSIMGTGFPAPPSANNSVRVPSADGTRNFSNLSNEEKYLAHVQEEEFGSDGQSEPASPVYFELEAPLETLSSDTYSQPRLRKLEHHGQQQQRHQPPQADRKPSTTFPTPPYNSADPFSLAPDLGFSSMDLLPLPPRAYSPSLSTSRSSGVGSQSSALTPVDGNCAGSGGPARPGADAAQKENVHGLGVSGVHVVGNGSASGNEFICELDIKRNSVMPPAQGANSDVLAAWNALGGV